MRFLIVALFIAARYRRPGRHERRPSTPYIATVAVLVTRLTREFGEPPASTRRSHIRPLTP